MFGRSPASRLEHHSESEQSDKPLLEGGPGGCDESNERHVFTLKNGGTSKVWLIHGVFIGVYTVVYAFVILSTIQGMKYMNASGKDSGSKSLLPSRAGLQWEERKFPTNIVDNPFAGPPRQELDDAWHHLLQNDNIRVPKDYLDARNLTSVYTKDGSDAIASLSVYHSLHCLKKVKKMLYKEYYHALKSEEAMAREEKHVDHCVEYIRESLMCQPDLSLVTFRWINNTAQHEDKSEFYPTNFDRDVHTCANWEHLDDWAGRRMFNLFDVDLLQRPGNDHITPS